MKKNEPIWNSQLVEKIEKEYTQKNNERDKLNFLITTFLDYRLNHSHGEYDIDVVIDEKTEIERNELSDFLVCKFQQLQPQIRPQQVAKPA